ncbi:MAG: hypothetical protein GZ094_00980 [Mariniphaga sp.]|nr:hypothetical protein [Mariniphaga sp.]
MTSFDFTYCKPTIDKIIIIEHSFECIIQFVKLNAGFRNYIFNRSRGTLVVVSDHADSWLHLLQNGKFGSQ